MDHQEQKHEHHKKEREEKLRHQKEWEREHKKLPTRISPLWFVILGMAFIALVIIFWTMT